MTKKTMGGITLAVFSLIGLLVLETPAAADTISFDLTVGNLAIAGYPGPYATVMITASGGDALVTVTGDNGYKLGDGSAVALNVIGAPVTVDTFSFTGGKTSGGGILTAFSQGNAGNVSTFGSFNTTINNTDGGATAVDSVTFTVHGTFANAGSVLVANAGGYLAAAHIFVIPGDAAICGEALSSGNCTGFAAAVPEPASLLLLGSGLAGLGLWGRKRRKNVEV